MPLGLVIWGTFDHVGGRGILQAYLNAASKYLSNFISVVGLLATLYLSIFYVPSYVEDIAESRGQVIHESLMDDIQELIFFENELSIEDIQSLIHGRELQQGVQYRFSADELLMQVQERFMGNKFIPLEKRRALFERINSIRAEYKPAPEEEKDESFFLLPSVIGVALSLLGVLLSSFATFGLFRKYALDREIPDDIIADIIVEDEPPGSLSETGFQYEKMIGEALAELGVLKEASADNNDTSFDFMASTNRGDFIVEVKWYRRLLGAATALHFTRLVKHMGLGGILIVNSGLTHRAREIIQNHNETYDDLKIHVVSGKTKPFVMQRLKTIFNDGKPN